MGGGAASQSDPISSSLYQYTWSIIIVVVILLLLITVALFSPSYEGSAGRLVGCVLLLLPNIIILSSSLLLLPSPPSSPVAFLCPPPVLPSTSLRFFRFCRLSLYSPYCRSFTFKAKYDTTACCSSLPRLLAPHTEISIPPITQRFHNTHT